MRTILSAAHRSFEFGGKYHAMSEEEYQAIECSGRSSLFKYLGIDEPIPPPPIVQRGQIKEMDERPGKVEPGKRPVEFIEHRPRISDADLSPLQKHFIRLYRKKSTMAAIAYAIRRKAQTVQDYCRSEGYIRPYRIQGPLTGYELRREFDRMNAEKKAA